MGKGRGGKYDIEKRDLEAVRVLTFIVDKPGCTRKEIATGLSMTVSRVGDLVTYLKEYADLIEELPNEKGRRKVYHYTIKLPLSHKARDIVMRSGILVSIIKQAGGYV